MSTKLEQLEQLARGADGKVYNFDGTDDVYAYLRASSPTTILAMVEFLREAAGFVKDFRERVIINGGIGEYKGGRALIMGHAEKFLSRFDAWNDPAPTNPVDETMSSGI